MMTVDIASEDIIDSFLFSYKREYDFYLSVSKYCADFLQPLLRDVGVRAIVTYRAKSHESLRAKLQKRNIATPYLTRESIYDDIADLSGVRVALYFPNDLSTVESIILKYFSLIEKKDFPLKGKESNSIFPGYVAQHFRVKLKDISVALEAQRYCDSVIEIQIASVLMHGWSEVEHDIVYKPENGTPSDDERMILEQINGLIITGEMALNFLKTIIDRRKDQSNRPFQNSYEMASFIVEYIKARLAPGASTPTVNRVDVIFRALTEDNINTPKSLRVLLAEASFGGTEKYTSIKIIETWLSISPGSYAKYVESSWKYSGRRYIEAERESAFEKMEEYLKVWAFFLNHLRKIRIDKLSKKKRKAYKVSSRTGLELMKIVPQDISDDVMNYSRVSAAQIFNGRILGDDSEIFASLFAIYQFINATEDYLDDVSREIFYEAFSKYDIITQ